MKQAGALGGGRRTLVLVPLGLALVATTGGVGLGLAAASGSLAPLDVALLGGVLALLLTAIAARALFRPLRRLAHATARVALPPGPAPLDDLDRMGAVFEHVSATLEIRTGELVVEHERIAAVLEGMREGLLALSPAGDVVLCNRTAMLMLGCTEPPIGRRLLTVLRLPALQERLREAAEGRWQLGHHASAEPPATPPRVEEIELALPEGRQVQASAHALGRAGLGTLLILRDVTALRRLETMRRDFVSNASHELRTPVATIRAATETLLDGALDDPAMARELAETVMRHSERLTRLLTDMLDLSRIEAGAYGLELGPVAVAERLRHAAGLLEPATQARRQIVAIAVNHQPIARANAAALDQILFNLLDNASKYTPEGTRIELSARLAGGRVTVRVVDDGPGIPLHQRERVFERFYRIDAGRSRQLGGTGLGLAIVRHLVESMGGRVGVNGNEPRGAAFWIELPAAEPPVADDARPSEAHETAADAGP